MSVTIFAAIVLWSFFTGVALTYLLKIELNFSERLVYGSVVSLSAFIQLLCLFTFSSGFKPLNLALFYTVIGVITALSGWQFYKKMDIIKADFLDSLAGFKKFEKYHLPLILLFWLIIFIPVFQRNFYSNNNGIFSNSSTDMPVHISIITSFVYGDNFPAMTPVYAGYKLVYPYLSDLFSAFLLASGADLINSLFLPAVFMCTLLTFIVYFFTFHLTNSKAAAALSPFLLYLAGGFGFIKFFETDFPASGYNFFKSMMDAPNLYSDQDQFNLNFFNFIIGYLLPQRSFLFGFPISLTIIILVWLGIQRRKKGEFLLAGFLGGLLPLFHTHSFMSVSIISAFLFLLFFRKDKDYIRQWACFFLPLVVLALPQVLYIMSRVPENSMVFKPYYGWVARDSNYIWFWIKNTGFFMFLVIDALLLKSVSRDLKKFYIPCVFLFIIANLISFSPCWIGDNAKIIIYWFICSIPLVSFSLVNLFKTHKLIAVVIILTLTLVGILDITKSVFTDRRVFMIWSRGGVMIAREIREHTPPGSVFFNAPVHFSPIFLSGRPTLMGDPMHVCAQGINLDREQSIKTIFESNKPQLQLKLLKLLGADYALVGPTERERLKDKDFFEKHFKVFIDQHEYKVFKLKN
jgi:hypothetical protein